MKTRRAIIQANLLLLISVIAAFSYNAISDNGINPFRRISGKEAVVDSEEAAKQEMIKIVNLEKFRNMREAGAVVMDARTEDEYERGHIPGALLFDYYQFPRYLEKNTPILFAGGKVVIYCSSVTCEDAELLARELHALDYDNLYVYQGGFSEWKENGLPVEEGTE